MTAYIHAGKGNYTGNIILDVEHEGQGRTWMFDSAEPTLDEVLGKYEELRELLNE